MWCQVIKWQVTSSKVDPHRYLQQILLYSLTCQTELHKMCIQSPVLNNWNLGVKSTPAPAPNTKKSNPGRKHCAQSDLFSHWTHWVEKARCAVTKLANYWLTIWSCTLPLSSTPLFGHGVLLSLPYLCWLCLWFWQVHLMRNQKPRFVLTIPKARR